ncbi:MAG: hypothetical protein ACXVIT_10805 [Halobacteriota archaeon]
MRAQTINTVSYTVTEATAATVDIRRRAVITSDCYLHHNIMFDD